MCKGKIKFYDSITFDHLSFDWVFLDLQHRVAKCEIKKGIYSIIDTPLVNKIDNSNILY